MIKGVEVHFDENYLHVKLEDGRIISTPMDWYATLQKATIEELKAYRFIAMNTGIEWEALDYHLNIEGIFIKTIKGKIIGK